MNDLLSIIITAILSPLALEALRYFFAKSSEQTRSVNAKIEGLEKRVDELKEKNLQQAIEIAVLKAQLLDRDVQMAERDKLIAELKKEIEDLQKKGEAA
jgi:chromosome segregation ATPase